MRGRGPGAALAELSSRPGSELPGAGAAGHRPHGKNPRAKTGLQGGPGASAGGCRPAWQRAAQQHPTVAPGVWTLQAALG